MKPLMRMYIKQLTQLRNIKAHTCYLGVNNEAVGMLYIKELS
jgi:hypothetical protein